MQFQTQRSLLLTFIGSIAACGLVGIYCLLIGRIGWFEERILGTTCVVGAASILALASAVTWERRRWHPVGPLGAAAATVALVLAVVAIWAEPIERYWPYFYDALSLAWVAAVALPHVGLLSLARLRPGYEWVRRWTSVVVFLLALLIALVLLDFIDDSDLWLRPAGILAIADACGTIAVPILHRVSAIRKREEVRTVELTLALTCPRCQQSQTVPVGRSKCAGCGLGFRIDIDEGNCKKCGYPLYRLESAQCPECGTPIAEATESSHGQEAD